MGVQKSILDELCVAIPRRTKDSLKGLKRHPQYRKLLLNERSKNIDGVQKLRAQPVAKHTAVGCKIGAKDSGCLLVKGTRKPRNVKLPRR